MKRTYFVIVVGVQHPVASCSCYIALDGYSTILKSKAARFQSFADAKAFAEVSRIAVNGTTYIGLEDFTDVELKGQEPFDNSGQIRRNIS